MAAINRMITKTTHITLADSEGLDGDPDVVGAQRRQVELLDGHLVHRLFKMASGLDHHRFVVTDEEDIAALTFRNTAGFSGGGAPSSPGSLRFIRCCGWCGCGIAWGLIDRLNDRPMGHAQGASLEITSFGLLSASAAAMTVTPTQPKDQNLRTFIHHSMVLGLASLLLTQLTIPL